MALTPEQQSQLDGFKRKVQYLAQTRSILEADRLWNAFLAGEGDSLTLADCQMCLALLHYPDADLYDWVSGLKPAPEALDPSWLQRLAKYCT
ncbi:succinate dehydrogenase assembly factor 2 [Magnetofaba australis]|uniref:FAD assembly factor SdhE n=1 Tax=Magnetofaba australis IT-1 TaxID=1434232 RepID=A0A1Y2KA18_9PROT|nr:succinate dehydrogenase assembly factor 2 [Magnetofaba australis]OSM08458.1 hypothetical protein MAIT1_04631 [Magnetofaba australis IT-1]